MTTKNKSQGDNVVKKCFIAMPITTEKNHVEKYGDQSHWNHLLHSLISPAVEKAGFVPVEPLAQGSELIHHNIVKNINEAELVLVDLSTHNPNVFFELGMRIALNKPIVLIVDDLHDIPFDLQVINCHKYPSRLSYYKINEEIEKLANHISKSWESDSEENSLWKILNIDLTPKAPSQNGFSEALQLVILDKLNHLAEEQDNIKTNLIYRRSFVREGKNFRHPTAVMIDSELKGLNLGEPYKWEIMCNPQGKCNVTIRHSLWEKPNKNKILELINEIGDDISVKFVPDDSLPPF